LSAFVDYGWPESTWARSRTFSHDPDSAAGKGVFDQVVNVVEGDVVDGALDFEEARGFAFEEDNYSCLDRRAAGFYAGDFFDDDRRVLALKPMITPYAYADDAARRS
jgi:hypothetical protein